MKNYSKLLPILFLLILATFSGCIIEEEDPNTDPRDKFLGDWKVDETCSRGNYIVTISYDPSNSTQVLLKNFGNPGSGYDPAVGFVVGNELYISSQTIGPSWTVSGQGSYVKSNETIGWNYSLTIGGNLLQCSALYSR